MLDFHTAKDNPFWSTRRKTGKRCVRWGPTTSAIWCAHDESGCGDMEAVLADCDVVIDHVYHTAACQQAMMETFRTYCCMDAYGRLNVLSSTQIVSTAPDTVQCAAHPQIEDPRGKAAHRRRLRRQADGGLRSFPGLCDLEDRKTVISSSAGTKARSHPPRAMRWRCTSAWVQRRTASSARIDLYTLSNTGAYGEHGPTTVGLSGHKSIPLYGKAEAFRFVSDVVYTNQMSAGAYRGYGATQGLFAVESAVNELAAQAGHRPFEIR